jgi:hypothetical protein
MSTALADPSGGCGGSAFSLVTKWGYDFHEIGGYLVNVGKIVGRAFLFAALLFAAPAVNAGDRSIETFYGHFIGKTTTLVEGESARRNIGVEVQPVEDDDHAFTIEWDTVIARADGSTKASSYKILFQHTKRKAIYSSAMRVNVFGKRTPLDPMSGDPFVWARITGDTLTVFVLLITDAGSYEMQVYDRTLTGDKMMLRFSRVRDGEKLKEIIGTLTRVSD